MDFLLHRLQTARAVKFKFYFGLGLREDGIADGVEKILMTTCNVSPSKIRRAMKIRKANRSFIQAVDNPRNAQDLSDAAKEADQKINTILNAAQ